MTIPIHPTPDAQRDDVPQILLTANIANGVLIVVGDSVPPVVTAAMTILVQRPCHIHLADSQLSNHR